MWKRVWFFMGKCLLLSTLGRSEHHNCSLPIQTFSFLSCWIDILSFQMTHPHIILLLNFLFVTVFCFLILLSSWATWKVNNSIKKTVKTNDLLIWDGSLTFIEIYWIRSLFCLFCCSHNASKNPFCTLLQMHFLYKKRQCVSVGCKAKNTNKQKI